MRRRASVLCAGKGEDSKLTRWVLMLVLAGFL